jgi:hypothetical protein
MSISNERDEADGSLKSKPEPTGTAKSASQRRRRWLRVKRTLIMTSQGWLFLTEIRLSDTNDAR